MAHIGEAKIDLTLDVTVNAPDLSDEQRARAAALSVAKAVLKGRSHSPMTEAPAPDPVDLHSLAVFVLDGGDPWELEPVREAGGSENERNAFELGRDYQRSIEADRVNEENARGGEAREVVLQVGRVLGLDITKNVRGHLWSPENMGRVVKRAEARQRRYDLSRGAK